MISDLQDRQAVRVAEEAERILEKAHTDVALGMIAGMFPKGDAPGHDFALVVPEISNTEITNFFEIFAWLSGRNNQVEFITADQFDSLIKGDLEIDYATTIVVRDAEKITSWMQAHLLMNEKSEKSVHLRHRFCFLVSQDPSELHQNGTWLLSFRRPLVTSRYPTQSDFNQKGAVRVMRGEDGVLSVRKARRSSVVNKKPTSQPPIQTSPPPETIHSSPPAAP